MKRQLTRRAFIKGTSAGLIGLAVKGEVFASPPKIKGEILGASSSTGHLLREGKFPPPSQTLTTKVAVIGGGMAALSAAWRMNKKGLSDFLIFELENETGGNSRYGENKISPFPWGAHYVPAPGEDAVLVRELFEELGVITGKDSSGKPIYNDFYLCAAPEERLFMRGSWQEGLVPNVGVPTSDSDECQRFFEEMRNYRQARGKDGKRAFTIPIDESSSDEVYRALDRISMEQYLASRGYRSEYLGWYVNYCCRDDYGTTLDQVSAWAGIHYFASRDVYASNLDAYTVITWPEGNGWILKKLREKLAAYSRCSSVVYEVTQTAHGVETLIFDPTLKQSIKVKSEAAIYCAPRFTSKFIIDEYRRKPPAWLSDFSYAPWMVANITLSSLPSDSKAGTAWDNVIFNSTSLGYVSATHQSLARQKGPTVWTYYYPLSANEPAKEREAALAKPIDAWQKEIVSDLSRAHKDIERKIDEINVWLWGHAMIRPTPGFLWGKSRAEAQRPLGRVFFAHSDLSGISIFEEAQYQGVKAADDVLALFNKERAPAA